MTISFVAFRTWWGRFLSFVGLLSARKSVLLLLVSCSLVGQAMSRQTESRVRHIVAADSAFAGAMRHFDAGSYQTAHRQFEQISRVFPLNRNSTAALLMQGKSSYRLRHFDDAIAELTSLIQTYPTSGYLSMAERTIALSKNAIKSTESAPIAVGIVLSLDPEEVVQTQQLFNGIRLAIDDYNASVPAVGVLPRIRMVFRQIERDPLQIHSAVASLADEGVAFIVGALFSDQAILVAEEAERMNIVYIAPLATDERVSDGYTYTFQANPTISIRGKLMARFAVNGLLLKTFGIIAREDDQRIGVRMADAFVEEVSRLGAEINYISLLPDEGSWYHIRDSLKADTLQYIDAIYTPISANDPDAIAGTILDALDRLGHRDVRVLGNSAWHNLPMRGLASKFLTTYTNDYVQDSTRAGVIRFQQDYAALSGESPGRLGYSGYDLTRFLIDARVDDPEDSFVDVLHRRAPYDGLGSRFDFTGGNVNRALFYHRYRDGTVTLIR